MTLPGRAADLAYMLRDAGVLITLGAISTYGLVRAADVAQLQEGPVGVVGRGILVTIARDSLPALRSEVAFTVDAGPLAGTYIADQILGAADGEALRFTAYPTTSAAADLWARGAILLPWSLRVPAVAAGPVFDLAEIAGAPVLALVAELTAQGADPRLNVKVQHCATENGTFEDAGVAFEEIDEDGGDRVLVLNRDAIERYIRLVPAVTGTLEPEFWCGAVALDVAVPRP